MEIQIDITTPPGQAKGFSDKLKAYLNISYNSNYLVNDTNDRITLSLSSTPKKCYGLLNNIYKFNFIAKKAANSFVMKPFVNTRKKQQELNRMLDDTKVSFIILKEPTAEELIEDNKSFWNKLKDKFMSC